MRCCNKTMEAAWSRMKNSASGSSRSEFGFYIYKKQPSGEYYVGEIVEGPATTGCEGTNASISLGRVIMFVPFSTVIRHFNIVRKHLL